jgi:hypothetical protein
MRALVGAGVLALVASAGAAQAGVMVFGSENCLGTGCYGATDPTAGVTLEGLAPGVVSTGAGFGHAYPFSPGPGDFPGTDQMYVGSVQTGFHDGYSVASQRINGPDVMTMDYSALVGPGQKVKTLTLGVAADDFQNPVFGQPFTATLNGAPAPALTTEFNGLNESGPQVELFTIGLNRNLDTPAHTLTLSIDEGGDGGDGWAVDYLTVGVTTAAIPEPGAWTLMLIGVAGLGGLARQRRTLA